MGKIPKAERQIVTHYEVYDSCANDSQILLPAIELMSNSWAAPDIAEATTRAIVRLACYFVAWYTDWTMLPSRGEGADEAAYYPSWTSKGMRHCI